MYIKSHLINVSKNEKQKGKQIMRRHFSFKKKKRKIIAKEIISFFSIHIIGLAKFNYKEAENYGACTKQKTKK